MDIEQTDNAWMDWQLWCVNCCILLGSFFVQFLFWIKCPKFRQSIIFSTKEIYWSKIIIITSSLCINKISERWECTHLEIKRRKKALPQWSTTHSSGASGTQTTTENGLQKRFFKSHASKKKK
jgi:hypothetical protein